MLTAALPTTGILRCLRGAGFLLLSAAVTSGCATYPAPVPSPAANTGNTLLKMDRLTNNAGADSGGGGSQFMLGIGDELTVQVYGRPELNTTTYVAEDGSITIPLAGAVPVAGLSPVKAGHRVAAAFRNGKFLVDPQVTVTMAQFRGQQVSVLGAVKTPGRFVIESKTTVLDVLAQAGGITESGGNAVVLLRPGKNGKVQRYAVDMKGLSNGNLPVPTMTLRGGDSIFVPPADQFSIYGEVRSPNMYRLEPGMTVVQAISRGGGITPRGSNSRIEIMRRKPDGTSETRSGNLNDFVLANDVIRVKERFF